MSKKKKIVKKTKKTAKTPNTINGVDEAEFLIVLENISKRLANKFKFGYHDYEDMKQQASIFAIEGLEKYDHSRPLENFLWTHVRNRLFNYKRNNYKRPDPPCLKCPLYDKLYQQSNNQCIKYLNKNDCDLYNSWDKRNNSKKNLMSLTSIDNEKIEINQNIMEYDDILLKELIDILDNKLFAPDIREIYLRLKNNCNISKADVKKLIVYIKDNNLYDIEE